MAKNMYIIMCHVNMGSAQSGKGASSIIFDVQCCYVRDWWFSSSYCVSYSSASKRDDMHLI